jgi:hypothetical protein
MISLETDLEQIAKIKTKFDKYPPALLGKGLDNVSAYLNSPLVKMSIYPPSQSGQKFIWSSERQRRYVMANIKLPSVRTFQLADAGSFEVEKKFSSFYIYYKNSMSYAKWVIGSFTRIIGHIARGWKPVNSVIVDKYRNDVISKFDEGTKGTWNSL